MVEKTYRWTRKGRVVARPAHMAKHMLAAGWIKIEDETDEIVMHAVPGGYDGDAAPKQAVDLSKSVKEVKKQLDALPKNELMAVYEIEHESKGRKSVLSYIDKLLTK